MTGIETLQFVAVGLIGLRAQWRNIKFSSEKTYTLDEFWGKFAIDMYHYDKDLFMEVAFRYRNKQEIPLTVFSRVVNRK